MIKKESNKNRGRKFYDLWVFRRKGWCMCTCTYNVKYNVKYTFMSCDYMTIFETQPTPFF